MKLLQQSTAVTVKVGPFLDSTDAVTAKTALTLAQADCILFLNNGAGAQKNSATSATHDTGGVYGVPLSTTDTGTLGPLKLLINKSSALPVWDEWMVVPSNVYTSLVSGTTDLKADVDQIKTNATAATNLSTSAQTMQPATVDTAGFSSTTTEFETSTLTVAAASHYVGKVVIFTSGTLQYQATRITAYSLVSARGHFTVQTLTSAPANGVTFIVV